MTTFEPLLVVALLVVVAGAAILAAAEVSIIRVRRSEVLVDARSGHARSQQLLRLIDALPVVLNCVLLLVLLLQVAAASIAAFLAQRWFGGVGVTAATFVTTGLLFVYAEAIPKTRAIRSPHRIAVRLTPVLRLTLAALRPLVLVLARIIDLQTSGQRTTVGAFTEDEIRALAAESAEVGQIAESDADLVSRSFEFNDRRVDEVMVARDDITAVRSNEDILEALDRAITSGHRRLPVLAGGLDDVVGLVHLRDLAAQVSAAPTAVVSTIMTDVLRCPTNQPVASLLGRMQEAGRWLAIVVDECDRSVGLVTVEDLVAELLGEVSDP